MGYGFCKVVFGEGCSFRRKPGTYEERRIARSLGMHPQGFCPMYLDGKDPSTVECGAAKRTGKVIPPCNRRFLRLLRWETRKFCKRNFQRLKPSDIKSFEEWLDSTNYNEGRKAELRKVWEDHGCQPPRTAREWRKCRRLKSFIKVESAMKDNYAARHINSRSDWYKCVLGPIAKAMEEKLYDLDNPQRDDRYTFIKHVPVRDRPAYMDKVFRRAGHGTYVETDHTAFEAHMTAEIMRNTEFIFYQYLLRDIPGAMSCILGTLDGVNICSLATGIFRCVARRMSGELVTSLGNGIVNLIVFLATCRFVGCTVLAGFCEGDDGLFKVRGRWPSIDEFALFGFEVKLEAFENWHNASFCGMNMTSEKIDGDIKYCIVRDPLKLLVKTGYTDSKFFCAKHAKLMELLKSKAYSLAYENEGCPLAGAIGRYIMRMVGADVKPRFEELGWMSTSGVVMQSEPDVHARLSAPVLATARSVVAKKYLLSIADQLTIEKYFDDKTNLTSLDHPVILNYLEKRFPLGFELGKECLVW